MPETGTICRAMPVAAGPPAALVLVMSVDESTQSATVTLLTPDVEFGASADIVIGPEDSGLAYTLLAESDIFGYVWCTQLDRALARLDSKIVDAVSALRQGDYVGSLVAGPPILERRDPRWNFKLHELARLQNLSADCTRQLLGS